MLTLFEHPLSPYAQKVKLALYEKGIPFEARMPNLFGDAEPEFVESSPRREVPSLVDGDFSVFGFASRRGMTSFSCRCSNSSSRSFRVNFTP